MVQPLQDIQIGLNIVNRFCSIHYCSYSKRALDFCRTFGQVDYVGYTDPNRVLLTLAFVLMRAIPVSYVIAQFSDYLRSNKYQYCCFIYVCIIKVSKHFYQTECRFLKYFFLSIV